jgi:hypothetical protein
MTKVVCDGCGKRSKCSIADPAPKGWFWFPADAGMDETKSIQPSIAIHPFHFDENVVVLACSIECIAKLPWRQWDGKRNKKHHR